LIGVVNLEAEERGEEGRGEQHMTKDKICDEGGIDANKI
jgi:hypothetical protein